MDFKRYKWVLTAFIVCLSITTVTVFAEVGSAYTTESDPLVTLSYIDKITNQLICQLREEITAAADALRAEFSGGADEKDEEPAGSGYEVVSLTYGQTLIALDSCEIVLRSGMASAVVELPDNISNNIGLSDLTAGIEILADEDIPKNHYLIIPRGDGRGIYVNSDTAYFMVRGEYRINGAEN